MKHTATTRDFAEFYTLPFFTLCISVSVSVPKAEEVTFENTYSAALVVSGATCGNDCIGGLELIADCARIHMGKDP